MSENQILKEEQGAQVANKQLPLQAYQLSKQFTSKSESFYALKKCSLVLNKGETVGLLGPNGAGKSTFFNLLSTYHNPTEGHIFMNGSKISMFSSFFKNTGLFAQDNICWGSMSIDRHLYMMRLLFGVPSEVVEAWLAIMGLLSFRKNRPNQLSSGMQRKLCFMICSLTNPQYKFLDEPTTGLDPMARKKFREILEGQKERHGSSSILTTHTMDEAEKACDRILMLINGQTVICDSIENLKNQISGYTLKVELAKGETSLDQEVFECIGEYSLISKNGRMVTLDLFNVSDLAQRFKIL